LHGFRRHSVNVQYKWEDSEFYQINGASGWN